MVTVGIRVQGKLTPDLLVKGVRDRKRITLGQDGRGAGDCVPHFLFHCYSVYTVEAAFTSHSSGGTQLS